jgi:hypothetical protein
MNFRLQSNTDLNYLQNKLNIMEQQLSENISIVLKLPINKIGVIYEDNFVKFIWDANNKQPMFSIKNFSSEKFINGGIQLIKENYISVPHIDSVFIKTDTEYYFSNDDDGKRLKLFDMNSLDIANTWIIGNKYPNYSIKWIIGYNSSLTVIIEKRF